MNVRQMVETARTLNPAIETVIRSHNEDEARLLTQESAVTVFLGEHELAQAMARDVVRRATPA
jgi:CPA2 family monovalent cation:H+ antiporter-2